MELIEKARIRLEHWISHSDQHYEEYETFAKQLEEAGKSESAKCIREMMTLTTKSTECLKEALKHLD